MSIVQSIDDFLFGIGIPNSGVIHEAPPSHQHSEEEQKPSEKDLKFIKNNTRKFVRVRHTDYVGQIVGVNFRTHGMFSADRCPVWVSLLNKALQGTSSCYAVAQLEVISQSEAESTLTRLNSGFFVAPG